MVQVQLHPGQILGGPSSWSCSGSANDARLWPNVVAPAVASPGGRGPPDTIRAGRDAKTCFEQLDDPFAEKR